MITLEQAVAIAIVDGALAKGHTIDCDPLTVAVLDAGGHIVALKREETTAASCALKSPWAKHTARSASVSAAGSFGKRTPSSWPA